MTPERKDKTRRQNLTQCSFVRQSNLQSRTTIEGKLTNATYPEDNDFSHTRKGNNETSLWHPRVKNTPKHSHTETNLQINTYGTCALCMLRWQACMIHDDSSDDLRTKSKRALKAVLAKCTHLQVGAARFVGGYFGIPNRAAPRWSSPPSVIAMHIVLFIHDVYSGVVGDETGKCFCVS